MNSLGKSDISVQYIENENVGNINFGGTFGTAGVFGSTEGAGFGGYDYTNWGVGFEQDVDAIGANFYLSYLHHEADYTGHTTANATVLGLQNQIDSDIDTVIAGARFRY